MRISDWSSDVCSSDLNPRERPAAPVATFGARRHWKGHDRPHFLADRATQRPPSAGGCRRPDRRVQHPPRSEERRVGKEFGSTCGVRWSPSHEKKKDNTLKSIRRDYK